SRQHFRNADSPRRKSWRKDAPEPAPGTAANSHPHTSECLVRTHRCTRVAPLRRSTDQPPSDCCATHTPRAAQPARAAATQSLQRVDQRVRACGIDSKWYHPSARALLRCNLAKKARRHRRERIAKRLPCRGQPVSSRTPVRGIVTTE